MIDTKLLRQKILDLAIRGKLVPQDPTDEPASELLKKIKAEKDALVKAGKIKKDKHESHIFKGDDNRYYEQIAGRIADITDEIPFDLPDNWIWCRLKQVFSVVSARRVHKADWKSSGIPFYRAREIAKLSETGSINNDLFISEEQYNAFKQSSGVPSKGDLMVTAVGTIGKVYVVREHDVFYYKDASVVCFENHHSLNPYFYKNIFSAPFVVTQIYANSTGSTVDTITIEKAEQYLIPLPPLAEQQRIVEQIKTLLGYVDIIDTDAETLEKSITLAKQKILDLAIRGKLVPQDPADEPASELLKKIKAEKDALVKAGKIKKDKHESFIFKSDDNCYHENIDGKVTDITDEIPFELANGWSWCRLNNVASLADGDWIESKDQAPTGFRLIQTGNIGKCVFLPHDERARYISQETFSNLNCTEIFPGDCLISRLPDPLGRSCIIPDLQERMITAVDCTITRPYKLGLSSLYFMYFTGTTIYNEYVEKNATGSTRKRISRANLDKVLIPLPPIAEQKRIVSQVEKLFSVLETMRG